MQSDWPTGGPIDRHYRDDAGRPDSDACDVDLTEDFGVIDLPQHRDAMRPPNRMNDTPTPPAEIRVIDPVTGGAKGSKPERFDLIPFDAMDEVARVYGFGSKKYEDHNWAKGYKWGLSVAAMVRHISLWAMVEDNDKESGLNHMAHVAFHCLTLLAFTLRKLGTDDRWRK